MPLADGGGTALSVVLVVALVLGYLVLWAIWHFVFRNARVDDDDSRPDPPDRR